MGRFARLLMLLGAPMAVPAADIQASAPTDLIVTVYRAPLRDGGGFDLNNLHGFALITETRTVRLPAGESRVRFEGVADGIEPASALISGLASGVIEKNRDAAVLSPSALVAQAVGRQAELIRTNPKTGVIERRVGTLLSAETGVVFKTDQGIEALRCSGLPETFDFEPMAGLSARPTLSVLVRAPAATTQQVTLSYLSRGFDWSADYTATLSADGTSLDLGAWVTLVNGNGVGFPSAHSQVVAGRVNREQSDEAEVEPIDMGQPVAAQCWPQGSTSDIPMMLTISTRSLAVNAPPSAMAMRALRDKSADARQEVVVTASLATQEQLGDLKLYRVPERTTVASRQSKQVRFMDRTGIPVTSIYGTDLYEAADRLSTPAYRLLRTKNTPANHLGLPLPSGRVAVYRGQGDARQLESESGLRDLAIGQEVEIKMGESADVHVTQVVESIHVDSAHASSVPLVPGILNVRSVPVSDVTRVEISNARGSAIRFELRLPPGRVMRADHPLASKDGRPIFLLSIPAQGQVMVRYQTEVAR
jgi:hypothetical protein